MISALRDFAITPLGGGDSIQRVNVATVPAEVIHNQRPPLKARLAAFYYCFSFGYFFWIWGAILALCYYYPVLLIPSLLYACYAVGPGAGPSYDGSWPTPLKRWAVWRALGSYFPSCTLHKTSDLPPDKSYIFGQHPHGIFVFSGWLTFCSDVLGWSDKFPGVDARVGTLNLNFRAPFLREYLLLHGVCSVNKSAIINMLNAGKSVVLAIGGSAESLLTAPGKYDLVLRRRRGFVHCALETGASLVPVILFGEVDTYSTVNSLPEEHVVRRWQRWLMKKFGFTLPLIFGPGVFLKYGLLPYPVPLNVVVGAPIEVEKYPGDPEGAQFEALVDNYHAKYIAALEKLFHDHKEKYAKNAADLKLVE